MWGREKGDRQKERNRATEKEKKRERGEREKEKGVRKKDMGEDRGETSDRLEWRGNEKRTRVWGTEKGERSLKFAHNKDKQTEPRASEASNGRGASALNRANARDPHKQTEPKAREASDGQSASAPDCNRHKQQMTQ